MTVDFNSILRRSRGRLVDLVSAHPALYYGLREISGTMDYLCVRDDTELLIEGYPRSANSTTAHGFPDRQPRPVRLAHHKHHAAQLLLAAKRSLPAIVLIRQPEQAALSNLALVLEGQRRGVSKKRGQCTFQDALRGWLVFYRGVEPYVDAFVIAPFEEVTQDIGAMVRAVNNKFGTDFCDELLDSSQTKPLGWHAKPNEIRNKIKCELTEQFTESLKKSSQLRKMLDEANTLHEWFIDVHQGRSFSDLKSY